MKIREDGLSALQKQINDLQKENGILKAILERSGITYREELKSLMNPVVAKPEDLFDPDQGSRIVRPAEITDEMAQRFFSRFWGRQDVYAKRSVNRKTGKAGYYPQCVNFWKPECLLKQGTGKCTDCRYHEYKRVEKEAVLAHLKGESPNGSDVLGIYPLLPNNTCRFLVYDFDDHEKGAENRDFANTTDEWLDEIDAMRRICRICGIDPLVERSRSGKGAHIWIFFEKPIEARLVRKFGFALLDKGAESVNMKSFRYYDRMLPAQDTLPEGGLGNLIALPLQGRALLKGNSAFIDENNNAYPDQWSVLLSKPRLSEEYIRARIKEWSSALALSDYSEADGEKPWKNKRDLFSPAHVDGKVQITLSNGIYVKTDNLKPGIQNGIRRLAQFSNPVFYRNRAIGNSNFDTSPRIYLGKDLRDGDSGYIQIPRGLLEELESKLDKAGIGYEITDERCEGKSIDCHFNGELRPVQKTALAGLAAHDNGILHAATAFGKTVVCSALLAEKKVPTLIILESSALVEQWKESLDIFLGIDEELPKYATKTGRVKQRKETVGVLSGSRDSTTGIVDIAMAGSVLVYIWGTKSGGFSKLLDKYGMIICDECHHSASDTVSEILKYTSSRYVYGVTATPVRGDKLEKINYMLIGPVRYRYTTKEMSKEQGIGHYVIPRFTRTVYPKGEIPERMHPNEAYELLRDNRSRDDLITNDVRDCISRGRCPVVLSRYRDHSERLYEMLSGTADHVFLLTGDNKKEHSEILEKLKTVGTDESLILVATGQLIGEGFDYPRLDTLIMATPVSFRGVVEQYAGRLNRSFVTKKNVVIFDYVDSHIPMFSNMYSKRLKAYKQIGYDVRTDLDNLESEMTDITESPEIVPESIFDSENYMPVFRNDVLSASKRVIISCPYLSAWRTRPFIEKVKWIQNRGVEITLYTMPAGSYLTGEESFWMELHDEMCRAGINIKTGEVRERFAVIDNELVWYGSIELLGKSSVDDGMMRIKDHRVASELMELAWK